MNIRYVCKEVMSVVTPQDTSTVNQTKIFELLPGKILDLQINHPVQVRIKTPLIGYELGKYIILKHPDENRVGNYTDVLVAGNVVIVRYLLEGVQGVCFAFRTTIKSITQYPEKAIILDYPTKIENRQLRLHQRIITHLPAYIVLNAETTNESDVKITGIIGDISSQGCGFLFKADNAKLKVNKRDVFVCLQSLTSGEIKIPATVCNSRNENGKVSVGIKFMEGDKQVHSLLEHLFIDSNLL